MNKLHNKHIKEQFLSALPENTAKIYRYAFYRSYFTEKALQKDLYAFTVHEVIDAIKSANHSTLNSIKLTFNVFEKYTTWAAAHGYKSSNINQLSTVTTQELEKYLDKNKKLFLSEDEIVEIEDNLVNAQDQVVLRLIFEGALGYKNSELVNLTYHDVDWNNNTIKLKDDKTEKVRTISVSDRCLSLIQSALDEKEYYPKNGTVELKRGTFKVLDGEYVIRNARTGDVGSEGGRSDTHTIYRRMTTMSELFKYPYLTPKNVRSSGMIKMGKDLYEKKYGELSNDLLTEIAERYGVKKTNVGGYKNYNFSSLRETINADNIIDLYGELRDLELSQDNIDMTVSDLSFPEGQQRLKMHISRDRDPKVIKLAKEAFKRKHNGRLFCEICKFDFYEKYGELGKDFIEGHHTVPVSKLDEGHRTKIEDIAMVCSNCHQMLHKGSGLTKEQLGELLKR